MGRKKKEETAIVSVDRPEVQQVGSFIEKALAANASVETMERLFSLQKEVMAEQARSAFTQALSDFQRGCPEIVKDKVVYNKNGTVRYKFAGLDSITKQIRNALANAGLSYSWDTNKKENNIEVICTVTHIMGHSKTSTMEIPIAASEFMTQPQTYAAAQTFAKRYTLVNALGITTADEDTDATTVAKEKTAKSPKAQIVILLRRLGYNTDDVETIKAAIKSIANLELIDKNFEEIISRLEMSLKEKEQYDSENAGA